MDKYGVQNGNWRKQETEITTIKRIIYTKNKIWKKEFKGGKLSINKISTTSNKEPEKTNLNQQTQQRTSTKK